MREKRWVYFAFGVTAVLVLGAVSSALSDSPGLTLDDQGIVFADGSVQTTAATAGTVAVPCYCDGWANPGDKIVVSCWRADNDLPFSTVPAGQFLLINDLTLYSLDVGDFWVDVGKELAGSPGVGRPEVEFTGSGFPHQVHRSYQAPFIVLAAGEQLALRNLNSSPGVVFIRASGFLVPRVVHYL